MPCFDTADTTLALSTIEECLIPVNATRARIEQGAEHHSNGADGAKTMIKTAPRWTGSSPDSRGL